LESNASAIDGNSEDIAGVVAIGVLIDKLQLRQPQHAFFAARYPLRITIPRSAFSDMSREKEASELNAEGDLILVQ
jgi:hypothetical protein